MLSLTTTSTNGTRRSQGFHAEVINGLQAHNKYLQSKYFYDEEGDRLFQQIMACPEYYPTRCEMEIMQKRSPEIALWFAGNGEPFDLVELGPGDATKSRHLLRALRKETTDFTYYPIDISGNVIGWLEERLPVDLPGLALHGLQGEYMDRMEYLNNISDKRKIVLFMGANIGNMNQPQAIAFLRRLHDCMRPGDLLMIGFDLKKHPKTILDAYNDAQGITRAFNLNLLTRINRELGADFDLSRFAHYPVYDPGTGACKSFLISLESQQVRFSSGETIQFRANEPIYMEISQKYDMSETEYLARQSGFAPVQVFYDEKQWFADILWRRMA